MKTHKRGHFVTALLAIVAGLAVIAGVAAMYLKLGERMGPNRGAFIGLASVLLAVFAASFVMRIRLVSGRTVPSIVLGLVGFLGFASAWALRMAPESIAGFEPAGVYAAAVAVASKPPPLELWLILGAEIGILLAISISLAGSFKVRVCHWCSSACTLERDVSRRADPGSVREIRHRLERHHWEWFKAAGPPATDARSWVRFDLGSCTCGLTRTLRATRVRKIGLDREIVREIRLKPDDVRVVRGFGLPHEPAFEDYWGTADPSASVG